jgi:hypothetical protein
LAETPQWTEKQKAAVVAEAKPTPAQLPDMPPNLTRCLTSKHTPKGNSADAKVLDTLKHDDVRRACGRSTVAWYKTVQTANQQPAPAARP